MPPRSQLPLELLQALDHEHNSREVSFGEGCVRCLHTGKVLGCWAKVQLVVKLQGCKPNQQHMKKLELQGLTAAYKKQKAACLWCPMCTEAGKLAAAGRQVPSEEHAHVMRWLAGQCAQPFYIEHAVQCYVLWHGLVDAYFPMQHLCLQVDGKQHLDGEQMYHEEQGAQLQRDVAFNIAAWRGGMRTLRMHHWDAGPKGQHTVQDVLKWCDTWPGQPVLVLSHSYMQALVGAVTGQGMVCDMPYPQYMAGLLGARVTIDKLGSSWLHAAGCMPLPALT